MVDQTRSRPPPNADDGKDSYYGAIKWSDAISAFAQLRGLSGHTLWPSR
jgi:hypothetical protein